MKHSLYFFVLSGLALIVFILYTSVEAITPNIVMYEIETENANLVIEPMEVGNMKGASNNKGIVSAARYGITEGKASYEIRTKECGDYFFWGRCYWEDACSNSFLISIDKQSSYSFGQNPIMGKWHWVNLNNKLTLEKGINNLVIGSLETRSKMDKFILTTDRYYVPTDNENESKLYIDFQDGIPPFFNIDKENKYARIFNKDDNKSLLLENDGSIKDTINIKSTDNNYIYRMVVKSFNDQSNDNNLKLFFNYEDKRNYNCLNIINNQVWLSKVVSGQMIKDSLLMQTTNLLINNEWKTFSILKSIEKTIIKIAGKTIYYYINKVTEKGTVGISLNKGKVLIDNISYYTINAPYFKTNFHEKDFGFTDELPEFTTSYLKRIREGDFNWYKMQGEWNGVGVDDEDVIESIEGKMKNKNEALITIGDQFWFDFTFGSAVRITDEKGIGLCFYVQDSLNYYMFRWKRNDVKWIVQLLKIEQGNENILIEKHWNSNLINNWYKLEVKLNKGFILASIDDNVVFKDKLDHTFKDGKVGLWTSSVNGAYFDDIYIEPTNIDTSAILKKYLYSFRPNQRLALDYCDWIPSNVDVIKHARKGNNSNPYINKRFLEESYLANKRIVDNNFVISLFGGRWIPKDIDVFFRFNSQKNRDNNLYSVIIENNKAVLLINNKVVSVSKEFIERGKIKITHDKQIWKIENNDSSLIEFKDQNILDSTNIVFGYGGIGKARIPLTSIIIEEIND